MSSIDDIRRVMMKIYVTLNLILAPGLKFLSLVVMRIIGIKRLARFQGSFVILIFTCIRKSLHEFHVTKGFRKRSQKKGRKQNETLNVIGLYVTDRTLTPTLLIVSYSQFLYFSFPVPSNMEALLHTCI